MSEGELIFPKPTLGKILTTCLARATYRLALVPVELAYRVTFAAQRRAYNRYLAASPLRKAKAADWHNTLFGVRLMIRAWKIRLERKVGR